MKYLLCRKEKVPNENLEENLRQDQKAFAKELSLESLLNKLKAARNK